MKRHAQSASLRTRLENLLPQRVRRELLILLAGQIVSYFGAKFLIRSRVHICMALPLDLRIPLIPWTVVIYFGCFLFWAWNYALILRSEPDAYFRSRFFRAELLGKLICFFCYVILPTTLPRIENTGRDVFSIILRMLYTVDAPDCLFPSMHCFVSWMCVIGLRRKPEFSRVYRAVSVIAAVLVFAATLTTRQHVIADVVSGVVLAELCWLLSGAFGKRSRSSRT